MFNILVQWIQVDKAGEMYLDLHKDVYKQNLDGNGNPVGKPFDVNFFFRLYCSTSSCCYQSEPPIAAKSAGVGATKSGCRTWGKVDVNKVAGNLHWCLCLIFRRQYVFFPAFNFPGPSGRRRCATLDSIHTHSATKMRWPSTIPTKFTISGRRTKFPTRTIPHRLSPLAGSAIHLTPIPKGH